MVTEQLVSQHPCNEKKKKKGEAFFGRSSNVWRFLRRHKLDTVADLARRIFL